MKIIKRDFAGHTVQPVDFIEEGTVDKERSTLSGASASFQIVTGAYDGLEVTDSNGVTLILRTDTVTSTQILPAAAVPFAGTTQDLKDLLKEFFFFDIGAEEGSNNLLSSYGDTGEYNQTHYAFPFILTSTALAPGVQYTIPITLGGLYDEFALYQISAIVGKFNFAIYDGKTGAGQAFVPDQKVFQSPEFTTVAAATKIQLFNPATNFEQGQYFFSIIADSAFTFQGARIAGSYLGYASLPAFVLITRYITTGIYAATLPATYPAYFNDLANPANPVLWHKKTL